MREQQSLPNVRRPDPCFSFCMKGGCAHEVPQSCYPTGSGPNTAILPATADPSQTSLLELSWLVGGLLPKQNASEAHDASQAWQHQQQQQQQSTGVVE